MIGVSAPLSCLPPPPFYNNFLPPELGSQGRYLSHQPFPPIVGSGCKGRKAWLCQVPGTECNNGSLFLRHFPSLYCPFLFWYFSCSVKWSRVSLPVAGCSLGPRLHLWPRRVLPMAEEGFFLELGPWPNVDIDMGFSVLYPPHIANEWRMICIYKCLSYLPSLTYLFLLSELRINISEFHRQISYIYIYILIFVFDMIFIYSFRCWCGFF